MVYNAFKIIPLKIAINQQKILQILRGLNIVSLFNK